MGEKGAVVNEQQLRNEFLEGFRACENILAVEYNSKCPSLPVARTSSLPMSGTRGLCCACLARATRSKRPRVDVRQAVARDGVFVQPVSLVVADKSRILN